MNRCEICGARTKQLYCAECDIKILDKCIEWSKFRYSITKDERELRWQKVRENTRKQLLEGKSLFNV